MVPYLDNQHRLLESETLFAGSVNHVQVHSREVVKSALRFNAAAVVLAHNHPSGDPEPSQCDRNITGRLKEALELVDVKTLDHLVVGSDGIVSFAERGLDMKIISKRQAMTLYRQHPGSRLFRFSTGKYKWSGSICHYAGREVEDIRGVLAVFAERRQDRNGPYMILRSVTLS